jgi:hypothetical protein
MTYQGPPDWQPQQLPPPYGDPVYPPQQYPLPGQLGYPAPPAPTAYGYPSAESLTPSVSVAWTGWVLAAAGVGVAIGSLLTWARVVTTFGGPGTTIDIAGTSGQRDGKITVVVGAVMFAMGLLVVLRQGRLWVSVAGVVLCAVAAVVALADISDVSSTSKTVSSIGAGHIDVGTGLYLVLAAALVGLGASITALCVRRVKRT